MCNYLSGNLCAFYKFTMLFMVCSVMMSCLFVKFPFVLSQQGMKDNRWKKMKSSKIRHVYSLARVCMHLFYDKMLCTLWKCHIFTCLQQAPPPAPSSELPIKSAICKIRDKHKSFLFLCSVILICHDVARASFAMCSMNTNSAEAPCNLTFFLHALLCHDVVRLLTVWKNSWRKNTNPSWYGLYHFWTERLKIHSNITFHGCKKIFAETLWGINPGFPPKVFIPPWNNPLIFAAIHFFVISLQWKKNRKVNRYFNSHIKHREYCLFCFSSLMK